MSYNFDGNEYYMDGTYTSQYNSQGFSIVAWIYVAAAEWAKSGQRIGVSFGNDPATSYDNTLRLVMNPVTTDEISATARDTGDGFARDPFTDGLFDDKWVPVVGVFTSNTSRTVYIGDEPGASNTNEKLVGTALDAIRIGAAPNGYSNWRGLLAEVTLFNKALAGSELTDLYTENAGVYSGPPPPTVAPNNVIAYYPLNYNNATQTNDATGSAADASGDLTVTNAVYSSDHPTILTPNDVTLTDVLSVLDGSPIQ